MLELLQQFTFPVNAEEAFTFFLESERNSTYRAVTEDYIYTFVPQIRTVPSFGALTSIGFNGVGVFLKKKFDPQPERETAFIAEFAQPVAIINFKQEKLNECIVYLYIDVNPQSSWFKITYTIPANEWDELDITTGPQDAWSRYNMPDHKYRVVRAAKANSEWESVQAFISTENWPQEPGPMWETFFSDFIDRFWSWLIENWVNSRHTNNDNRNSLKPVSMVFQAKLHPLFTAKASELALPAEGFVPAYITKIPTQERFTREEVRKLMTDGRLRKGHKNEKGQYNGFAIVNSLEVAYKDYIEKKQYDGRVKWGETIISIHANIAKDTVSRCLEDWINKGVHFINNIPLHERYEEDST